MIGVCREWIFHPLHEPHLNVLIVTFAQKTEAFRDSRKGEFLKQCEEIVKQPKSKLAHALLDPGD